MNRNTLAKNGTADLIEVPRSQWTRSWTHKTTFNAGWLIPIMVDEDIIPGSTIKHKTSFVVRMSTPLYPTMDNAYLDTYFFKASKFWYWEHFRAQMGENEKGAWAQEIEYITPQINVVANNPIKVGDAANYMGIPIGVTGISFDKIPIQMYKDVWNQWFRDQNLQAPKNIDRTDANINTDGTIDSGQGLLPVNKRHDYFTSLLIAPQKGTPITTPIGTEAPIIATGPLRLNANGAGGAGYTMLSRNVSNQPGFMNIGEVNLSNLAYVSGLKVDLAEATSATINALRYAFATQRILEKDAIYGTRYKEILRGQFGVVAADEDLLMPEYLGGKQTPINIETVLQNSATSSESPLGYTGAFSVTTDLNADFTKSFTKHDILMGFCCIRTDHTYQQGIPRQFKRLRRLDHYFPALGHIGMQPVYNYEIMAQGTIVDNQVFGYKIPWQEYIVKPSHISGMLLSTYSQSLDAWHYGDDYATLPVLSDQWIRETQSNIDRTLAVQSSQTHQFIADFYFEQEVAAPISMNRMPGLIDHF